ncbi:SLC13 family permease [Amycolatopsis sp. YIM 10]|uniref:SLC13 family permease n=1 Tax=Amycolatopsis sp. YIM 10 TaxID=2653857 RepID=UPI00128FF775|nr:SLC13 family permease [Amycolatopsis sp. YIM 10]QFU91251.1 Citrate carrier [Amycolatopsis sp. YIM 10]
MLKIAAHRADPAATAAPRVPRWPFGLAAAAVALAALYLFLPDAGSALPAAGRSTLVVFAGATLFWLFGRNDTYVGFAALLALVFLRVLDADQVFAALGGETVWLLISAFVLAAGISATGLPARAAIALCTRASRVRTLFHLLTAWLVLTAFAIPATSGRAALALPVFLALARAFTGRPAVVRALALLIPTVILLSAAATLTGAGAHLITVEILAGATGSGISFGQWLLLGVPIAVLSSHLAAELVLLLMTRRAERKQPVVVDARRLAEESGVPPGPLNVVQLRALAVLALVVGLWCTEAWHGLSPALVALAGAVLITVPKAGTVALDTALSTVPWSLLLFMVATTALGSALSLSGAAGWLAGVTLGQHTGDAFVVLAVVVGVSAAAHLVLQSRSARSSVLVPLILPVAAVSGLNPAAAAFASTVAAGFCHTLPASAKPVALFSGIDDAPTYRRSDLLRLSVVLGPLLVLLVLLFATAVWPRFGLPLYLQEKK